MEDCPHSDVSLVNPYELIRKYICNSCGEVMMCACDEHVGRRFLSHQLNEGKELNSQRRVPVTMGFQDKICNSCRNITDEAYPLSEIYGRSSKIRRYYWREIQFETMLRFAERYNCPDNEIVTAMAVKRDLCDAIEKEVLIDIKEMHKKSPKYIYKAEPTDEVLKKYKVQIIDLEANYIKRTERKAIIYESGKYFTVEEYGAHYLNKQGFNIIFTESIPFHALFGILMWLLIQDPSDSKVRTVVFGDRFAYENGTKGKQIWTGLPEDFGTSNYAVRRSKSIDKHFKMLPEEKGNLLWLFDYWVEPSSNFRQYLWAHRQKDIETARQLIEILPVEIIHRTKKGDRRQIHLKSGPGERPG